MRIKPPHETCFPLKPPTNRKPKSIVSKQSFTAVVLDNTLNITLLAHMLSTFRNLLRGRFIVVLEVTTVNFNKSILSNPTNNLIKRFIYYLFFRHFIAVSSLVANFLFEYFKCWNYFIDFSFKMWCRLVGWGCLKILQAVFLQFCGYSVAMGLYFKAEFSSRVLGVLGSHACNPDFWCCVVGLDMLWKAE